jgi:hypothetical protein
VFRHLLSLTFVALALTATALAFLSNDMPDDAFITFRYAERLATGDGFTFNDGERVLGTTTPFYGITLAPFVVAFGPGVLPTAARVYALVLFLGTLALIWRTGFALSGHGWLASCLVLICGTSFWTSRVITYGMEIPLFWFMLALGLALDVQEKRIPAVLALGLLPMIRPEGAFVVGYVALYLLFQLWRSPQRSHLIAALILFAPGLLYTAIATAYYGSPVPQSITAKTGNLYDLPLDYTYTLVRDEFARYLHWPFGTTPPLPPTLTLTLALIVTAVSLFGGYRLARLHPLLGVLIVLPLGSSALYIASQTSIFPWYWGTFELGLLLCWAAGLHGLLTLSARNRPRHRAIAAVVVTVLVAAGNNLYAPQWQALTRPAYPYTSSRHLDYHTIAVRLHADLSPGGRIATPEIGVLGYFLPNQQILDAAGLVTPGAAPYFDGGGRITRAFVQAYEPDRIISPRSLIADDLLNSTYLQANFTLVDEYVHIHIYRATR